MCTNSKKESDSPNNNVILFSLFLSLHRDMCLQVTKSPDCTLVDSRMQSNHLAYICGSAEHSFHASEAELLYA